MSRDPVDTDESAKFAPLPRLLGLTDRYFAALVTIPPAFVLLAVAFVPFVIMLGFSLTDFSFTLPEHQGNFVGAANYTRVFVSDDRFWGSIRTTALFIGVTLPAEFLVGLFLAFLLHNVRLGRSVLLPLVSVPVVMAPVTTGLVWRLMLHGDYGPIGYYAQRLHLLSGESLLGSPDGAFWAVALIDFWQWTPFFVIVLLAGIEAIPRLPYESAAVDGATEWQILGTITIPLLRPAIVVALLFRFMDALKEFDKVFVLTHGGPASATEFLSIYAWIVSFEHGELGYASAITLLVFVVVLAFCNVVLWYGRKELR